MVTKLHDFNNYTDGQVITTVNSAVAGMTAFDNVYGTVTARNVAAQGGMAMRANLVSSLLSGVAWNVTGTTHYVRTYVRFPATGTHNMRFLRGRLAGATAWEVRWNIPTAEIDVIVGGAQRFFVSNTGDTPFPGLTYFMVEFKADAAGVELKVSDVNGNLIATDTWAGAVGNVDEIIFCDANGANITSEIWHDSIGYSDTDWLGVYSPVLTVDAGSDQADIEPYETVNLAAISSQPSVTWAQVGGEPVDLVQNGPLTATFTYPALMSADTLSFRATATHNGDEAWDDVDVSGLQHNHWMRLGDSWIPRRRRNKVNGIWQ